MTLKNFVRTGLPTVCATLALCALTPASTHAQKLSIQDHIKQQMAREEAAAQKRKDEAEAKELAAQRADKGLSPVRSAAPAALPAGPMEPGTAMTAIASAIAAPSAVASPAGAAQQQAMIPMSREQRLALVIGNSNYKSSPLINPTNDARAIANRLTQLGFTVIKRENASLEEMMSAAREFGELLRNGGVGLFYYAGHGLQVDGENYLVPVDANISREDEIKTRAYNVAEVLAKMDTAKNRINLVLLDACRDNPFARSSRGGSRGLAGMNTSASGMLVSYSTAPGKTASDGSGSNGLYTEKLLEAMNTPGMKVEDVFKQVRVGVARDSQNLQTPWEMSSIVGNFYFSLPEGMNEEVPVMGDLGGGGGVSGGSGITEPRQVAVTPRLLIPRKMIENYQLTANFTIQSGAVQGGFSSNGQYFALATNDKTLHVWNTTAGGSINTEPGFGTPSMSADRRYLMGQTDNGRITVLDLQSEVGARVISGLPPGVTRAALSPDGHRLLVYVREDGYYLIDTESSKRIAKLDTIDGDPRMEFSPTGNRLLTWGSRDSNMKLWDSDKGTRISRLSDHWDPVAMVRFSRDGAYLMSAAQNDKAVFYRTSDGDTIRRFNFGEGNPVPQMADFFQEGRRMVAYVLQSARQELGSKMHLGVWDSNSGLQVATLLGDGITVRNYRFSPDRTRLYVNAGDRNLYVFDMTNLKRVSTLAGAELLNIAPDGRRLIVKGNEGLRLVDANTLSPVARMPGQVNAYVSPKGKLFVTSAETGLLTLWNLENGDTIGQLKGHMDAISGALFSDDGHRLVTIGSDNVAKLWALPEIKDVGQLVKDQFESSPEYYKRLSSWTSPYSVLVNLMSYNADTQAYTVKVGDYTMDVPFERDAAKKLQGQQQAIVTGNLRFHDVEQLVLADAKLTRLP